MCSPCNVQGGGGLKGTVPINTLELDGRGGTGQTWADYRYVHM